MLQHSDMCARQTGVLHGKAETVVVQAESLKFAVQAFYLYCLWFALQNSQPVTIISLCCNTTAQICAAERVDAAIKAVRAGSTVRDEYLQK